MRILVAVCVYDAVWPCVWREGALFVDAIEPIQSNPIQSHFILPNDP